MLKKIKTKNLYIKVNDNYIDLESYSLVWNKANKEYKRPITFDLIIYNNKILLTDYEINFFEKNTVQKNFLVYEDDIDTVKAKDFLPYLMLFNNPSKMEKYFYVLNRFYEQSITTENHVRKLKNN